MHYQAELEVMQAQCGKYEQIIPHLLDIFFSFLVLGIYILHMVVM
jgi:hypothetical protein